jgi:ATP-dependent RNA helicase RhlE
LFCDFQFVNNRSAKVHTYPDNYDKILIIFILQFIYAESHYLCIGLKIIILTFEELNLTAPFLKAIADLEYVYPTPIQEKAFPIIMAGRNVIGIAQTGTGKTFAYLLPLLRQLTFSEQKDPRILILAPTRELVIQIWNEVKKLTKYTQLRSAGIYGGTNINTQKQLVYNGLDILVATPGRLIDLAFTGVLHLKNVQKLVIDEVDEMLGLGFRTQLTAVLEFLPPKRQNLMFSATLTSEVEALITSAIPIPLKIEIASHGTPLDKIVQIAYHVPNFNTKVNLLEKLLSEDEDLSKVVIFVGTKKLADRLFEHIDKTFPDQVGVIHSNKSHNYRLNALKQFQEGTHRLLIATDIIARGMDISDVTHVINFDIPDMPGDYIHRIGRTGRADKAGGAISFINQAEQAYQMEIEQLMMKHIPLEPLPENLIISTVFTEEERPTHLLFKKNHHKEPAIKVSKGAFQEKTKKNKKVNIGGPKIRSAKFDKFGKPKTAKEYNKPKR